MITEFWNNNIKVHISTFCQQKNSLLCLSMLGTQNWERQAAK